ncbi:small multi-drug export protein [Bariatricus massiliensis]|uniref:Small multi-drug export protein n=1 Tax=Bariatricus massiliensis TaxID=1745713 RepID=A0ABS8DKD4_9FIRM|nr:small multi-drug export protein [Bariatricus massiliensis]MCB7305359.1 small multi-drug export protein [Bariatricus massiliensis]MCB7375913.1 small multi-drug export protein [Bariatricus massiliensis]MCB7388502.1 small multi-drug export protein [Bariatricus massiliensis]MCB7412675.1 small multi-drug export protein [Bariatricus massiliensis]MCQ5252093.1 small multi-drug export protein [Bariatricus massiliensis]
MTESLVQWFVTHLGGKAAKEVIIFIISMVPILELRGGLLAAGPAFLDIPTWRAIPICLIGNLIPIPFILWLIRPIFKWLRKTKLFRPLVEKLEEKAMSKSDKIEKYEFLGLVLFVGIPLPGTGAWTGALIASLLDIDWKKAFLAIVLGVCLASAIMYFVSYVLIGGIFA